MGDLEMKSSQWLGKKEVASSNWIFALSIVRISNSSAIPFSGTQFEGV